MIVLYKSVPKVTDRSGAGEWRWPVASSDFELRGLAGRSHLFTTTLSCFPSIRIRYLAVVGKPS